VKTYWEAASLQTIRSNGSMISESARVQGMTEIGEHVCPSNFRKRLEIMLGDKIDDIWPDQSVMKNSECELL